MNLTPLTPNKENIKPVVPTQQPQIKSENKPVTPIKKEATPPIVVTPKITSTNPVIPQVINTKKEVTPISITPLMPNKSA